MAKKILIIDDDVELCEELREILKDEGYSAEILFEGPDAGKIIKKNVYDVIIIDYRISGVSGIELLRLIKDKNIKSKVFIVSGRPFIEKILVDENLSDIVSGFISKPFNIKTLLDKISAVV